MSRGIKDALQNLDEAQRAAACFDGSAVIAAGAGSGKTRVLSSRYLYLLVQKKYRVHEILTLTFTQKAAAELYERIYADVRSLSESEPEAREALEEFHRAKISTIDSFCSGIAKNACRRYGVSPDFSQNAAQAKIAAKNAATPFLLERRDNPAARRLLKKYPTTDAAASAIAETVYRYSHITRPIDFKASAKKQAAELERLWRELGAEYNDLIARMDSLLGPAGAKETKTKQAMRALVGKYKAICALEFPNIEFADPRALDFSLADANKKVLTDMNGIFADSLAITVPRESQKDGDASGELRDIILRFKDGTKEPALVPLLRSVAAGLYDFKATYEVFTLLSEFQDIYLEAKRVSGALTFADAAYMAVDALSDDPILRRSYKKELKAIMIDEFQDNNELQRDLLFLLAEDESRMEPGVPDGERVDTGKLFFVGDEKQSIYRFRGADVSVFKRLKRDLSRAYSSNMQNTPELRTNYRTEKNLIDVFNGIFPFVFGEQNSGKDYEAQFSPIIASRQTKGVESGMRLFIIDKDAFAAGGEDFDGDDIEAAFTARKIRDLADSGFTVADKNGTGARPCEWGDIVILLRAKTSQHNFEYHLRRLGVPYAAENQKSLYRAAPLNDFYSVLRLAVYPQDIHAYAVVLRSPFVSLSADGFIAAMIAVQNSAPFDSALDSSLSGGDRERFALGRALFADMRSLVDRQPITVAITRLWYEYGYRYSLLSKPNLARYAELYDYFFEAARRADMQNLSLSAFLDSILEQIRDPGAIEDIDVPAERENCVKIMTIHKSKGLEFPIVFLAQADDRTRAEKKDSLVFCSDEWGPTLNLNSDLPASGKSSAERPLVNVFFDLFKKENEQKSAAELRRLLYVAATRAETQLFITGTASFQNGDQNGAARNLTDVKINQGEPQSFFDLIIPALANLKEPRGFYTVISEPPSAESAELSDKESARFPAAEHISGEYASAREIIYQAAPPVATAVTALSADEFIQETPREAFSPPPRAREIISPADFGTVVHCAIEAKIKGEEFFIPHAIAADLSPAQYQKIYSEARVLTGVFFDSPLGRSLPINSADQNEWIQTEYSFMTKYLIDGGARAVSGKMDLVFCVKAEPGYAIYVVDFKTDREEIPSRHKTQLSVYAKAAADIWSLPVKSAIFYLRSGNTVYL